MKGPSAECADVAPEGGQREVNHDWLEANTVWSESVVFEAAAGRTHAELYRRLSAAPRKIKLSQS